MPQIYKNKLIAIIIIIIIAVSVPTGIVMYTTESEFQTYYYGSANVPHDVTWGDTVEGDVNYGSYCNNTSALLHSKEGDPYISGRGGSAENCKYVDPTLLGIAITGWANTEEYVDLIVPNSLTISHGGTGNPAAYGPGIDFNITADSLSEAMPLAGNITMEINAARTNANLSIFSTAEMEHLLIESSDGWMKKDGKQYGRIINMEKALDYAVNGIPQPPPPPPCTDCGWIPGAISYLLLLTDDNDEYIPPPPSEVIPEPEPEAPTSTIM